MTVDIQEEIVKRELKMGATVTKIMCNLRDLQDDQKTLGKVFFPYILSNWWSIQHLRTGYDSLK